MSTSNKRDVVDGTRGVRAGTAPVWVFDPQKIAQEEPAWWWNPLSYVTDEAKAYKLTQRSSGRRGSSAAKHTMEVPTPARGRPSSQYTP